METCANPDCEEPGTNKCSSCKSTPYCGPICQTAHWPTHKESCDGRLRKMGMDHLTKAMGFHEGNNWSQTLRHSDVALTKLMQMKDRPIEDISKALCLKSDALSYLGRYREQLECAKIWYCLWNTKPTDVGAIEAAFTLIQSCIFNKEYEDARLYASTLWGIINHKYDNKIPDNRRQCFIARGAFLLAHATLRFAQSGGIPREEEKKAGQEAIALLQKALEIYTQLCGGTEHELVAHDMKILAEAIDFCNDVNDDEVLRLFEQAKGIFARKFGSSAPDVADVEIKLGNAYNKRVKRAAAHNDVKGFVHNSELALSRYLEAARIFRALNRLDEADVFVIPITAIEERLQKLAAAKAALATTG